MTRSDQAKCSALAGSRAIRARPDSRFKTIVTQVSSLRHLEPDAQDDLLGRFRSSSVECGGWIPLNPGAPALLLVQLGLLNVYLQDREGERLLLEQLRPGALFSLGLPVDEDSIAHQAVAATPTTLAQVSASELEEHLTAYPRSALVLLGELCRRSRELTQLVQMLGLTDNARSRLILLLARLAREQGHPTTLGPRNQPGVAIPRLSHQQLADYVGLRRETVTRELVKLRKVGLIKPRDGYLCISETLLEMAGVEPDRHADR